MTNSKSIENSLQTKNVWQKILKNDVLKEKYAWHCDHIIVKMSKIQWYKGDKKAGKGAQTAKIYCKPLNQTHRRKSYGIRKKDQRPGNRT